MIESAFLIAALAMPVAMIPGHGRHYDIGVFQFMVKHYRKYHQANAGRDARTYLVGGDTDLLLTLRGAGIESWRVTIDPQTPYDIVAFADAMPLARLSSLVVVYMLEIKHDAWGSMRLWSETAATLGPDGLIVFYRAMAPHFSRLARAQGWVRLPFDWYEMEIWRKPTVREYRVRYLEMAA